MVYVISARPSGGLGRNGPLHWPRRSPFSLWEWNPRLGQAPLYGVTTLMMMIMTLMMSNDVTDDGNS